MGTNRIKGHSRDWRRHYQTTDSPKGCQFGNQEYPGTAEGCRKAVRYHEEDPK